MCVKVAVSILVSEIEPNLPLCLSFYLFCHEEDEKK
jgi:hypothetical protein